MNDYEKSLIEDNLSAIEIKAKYLYKKYAFPMEEFNEFFQTACLYVCNRVHKYDEKVKFSTFVNSILENAFIDRLRSMIGKRINTVSLDECFGDCEGEGVSLAEFLKTDNCTENNALAAISEESLKKYILRVKNKCTSKTTVRGFDALELKMQGYSGREISKIFNAPDNSVRMWISRAKKMLVNDADFAEFSKSL